MDKLICNYTGEKPFKCVMTMATGKYYLKYSTCTYLTVCTVTLTVCTVTYH